MLLLEYPKLETLSGGWLFYKATGKQIQHDFIILACKKCALPVDYFHLPVPLAGELILSPAIFIP